MITPKWLYQTLCEHVVAQDSAKKILSVAVYNHYKRCKNKQYGIEKSNVCIIGPSGCGKTFMLETLAEQLDIPVAFGDATTLTQAGYVGQDCEQLLARLLQAANNDIDRAENGIIFIDEFDKIGRKAESPTSHRDASGEGVQQALLTMFQGTTVDVPVKGSYDGATVAINTKNIMFVCSGHFESLQNKLNVDVKDLIHFGLIPEMAGRLHVVCQVNPLSAADLYKILYTRKNSLVSQYQKLFELDGCTLEVDLQAGKLIAEYAKQYGTGARGLKSILEKILIPYMFDLPGLEHCHIQEHDVHSALQRISIGRPEGIG